MEKDKVENKWSWSLINKLIGISIKDRFLRMMFEHLSSKNERIEEL